MADEIRGVKSFSPEVGRARGGGVGQPRADRAKSSEASSQASSEATSSSIGARASRAQRYEETNRRIFDLNRDEESLQKTRSAEREANIAKRSSEEVGSKEAKGREAKESDERKSALKIEKERIANDFKKEAVSQKDAVRSFSEAKEIASRTATTIRGDKEQALAAQNPKEDVARTLLEA